jgi:ribosomal protein L19
MKLRIKEFDDVIHHIKNKGYNSAIMLLKAMKKDAMEDEISLNLAESQLQEILDADGGEFII